jgi:hypothetical protein
MTVANPLFCVISKSSYADRSQSKQVVLGKKIDRIIYIV